MKSRKAFGLLVLAILMLVWNAAAVTEIDSCTDISSPGEYVFIKDIINTDDCNIGITASDVILDGKGNTLKGGVILHGSRITLKNLVTGYIGIYNGGFGMPTDNIIENNTVIGGGIRLVAGVFNSIIINNRVSYSGNGIFISTMCQNSTFSNNTLQYNLVGFNMQDSSTGTLINNIISNNEIGVELHRGGNLILDNNNINSNNIGIRIMHKYSDLNKAYNNIISSNRIGIEFTDFYNEPFGWFFGNRDIYNNYFNNTNNVLFPIEYIPYYTEESFWNISMTSGTNIVDGSYLGGNFWASPNGTGFGQTCTDVARDGICDSPYVLDANNIDYLPLAANMTSDTTAPDSVTNLKNITYASTYINWTWTDPQDLDFAKVMVYLDGVYKNDVLKGVEYYNVSLEPGTYTIGTRTVDTDGIINATMETHTATTILPQIRFINGTVIDSVSKAVISGVTISTSSLSTTTNAKGFYSLGVASGYYDLTATFDIRYYSKSSIRVSTVGRAVLEQDIELFKKPTGNITGSVTRST